MPGIDDLYLNKKTALYLFQKAVMSTIFTVIFI